MSKNFAHFVGQFGIQNLIISDSLKFSAPLQAAGVDSLPKLHDQPRTGEQINHSLYANLTARKAFTRPHGHVQLLLGMSLRSQCQIIRTEQNDFPPRMGADRPSTSGENI